MNFNGYTFYLASASPRRRKLLKLLNVKFKSFAVDLNEELNDGEHPASTVKRLAKEKMLLAKGKIKDGILITADTIVVLNKKILGKPKDAAEAKRMLKLLSGNQHHVYTGFAIFNSRTEKRIVDYEKTAVFFRELSRTEIDEYVKTGSPLDKAGAYGIQDDYGAVFIQKINGCYYNVVGLPLAKLYSRIKEIV